MTWISGGAMSGNCAVGSVSMETTPSSTVRIAITMATIGRRMKNFESIVRYLAAEVMVLEGGEAGAGCGSMGTRARSFCKLCAMTRVPVGSLAFTTQSLPCCGPRVMLAM